MTNRYTFIIAAAGQGTRLKPLTDNMPKSLLKIKNETILFWQLNSIPKEYIKEIIIIIGHEGMKIKDEIKKLKLRIPIKFIYNKDYKKCNCGFSFSLAKDFIKGPVIYINSDLIINKEDFLKLLNDKNENSLLVNIDELTHNDFLKGEINDNNEMISWPDEGYGSKGNCIIVGPFKISKETCSYIYSEFNELDIEFQRKISCYGLFSKGLTFKKFYGINILSKNFWEIDTYEDILNAENTFKIN